MSKLYDSIRSAYPNPVRSTDRAGAHTYCIGGALLRAAGLQRTDNTDAVASGFPLCSDIKRALCVLNPRLVNASPLQLRAYAVMDANDNGAFETAWAIVRELLEWTPELQEELQ